jgi:type I restriction enzyme S subunit
MINVKDFSFSEIMEGFYDGPHATPAPSEEGPVFLGIKNIKPDGGIDLSEIRHISESEYPNWTKRVVPRKNDIVFSYEATLHRYALIPSGFRGCLGRRMALIRVDEKIVDPLFLYYHFLSPYWWAFVETIKISGATVDRISIIDFPNFKISLPDLPTQKKIASILSAYDDLIENNNQRIQLLEEMAEEIYKEWFVRFRFPGYQDSKFFDKEGKEVPHDTAGALPEGWKDGTIGGLIEIKKGKIITQSTITVGLVPVVAGGLSPAYYHNAPNTKSPTITISASGANSGFVNLYYEDVWASDCSFIDSNMTDILYFFYSTLKVRQKEVFHLQRGAAQPHVYSKDIMALELKYPDKNLLLEFEELIKPFYDEIGVLKEKNQVLQETRDLLLPRLISGKLSVADIGVANKEPLNMAAESEAEYKS